MPVLDMAAGKVISARTALAAALICLAILGSGAPAFGQADAGAAPPPSALTQAMDLLNGDNAQHNVQLGLLQLKALADTGDADAQIALAQIYIEGRHGIEIDTQAGLDLLEKAGESRPDALAHLGEYLLRGTFVPADPVRAETALQAAAAGGQAHAAFLLGDALVHGSVAGLSLDPATGQTLLSQAIAAGNIEAMTSLGGAQLSGGVLPKDEAAGMDLLQRAGDGGSGAADYRLASFLVWGSATTPADPGRAATLFERAITRNNTDAMAYLGDMLARGRFVKQDRARGVELMEQAVANGNGRASFLLGQYDLLYSLDDADRAKALPLLQVAIDAGSADAMAVLGEAQLLGTNMPADVPAAARLLDAASAKGNQRAGFVLGDALLTGKFAGLDADPARGEALLRATADAGNPDAMARLGEFLLRGNFVDMDEAAGIALLEKAGDRGNSTALYRLGSFYLWGSTTTPADQPRATSLIEKSASLGNPEAMGYFGDMLARGRIVATDRERGIEMMQAAVDKGNARAMFFLGNFLRADSDPALVEQGKTLLRQGVAAGQADAKVALGEILLKSAGTEASLPEALELLEPAAAAGNADAAFLLGSAYLSGSYGLTADPAKAQALLRAAVEAGNPQASSTLSAELLAGTTLPQDIEAGLALLETAAQAGDNRAALTLGQIYLSRRDLVTPDADTARQWLERAAALGNPAATTTLAEWLLKQTDAASRQEGSQMLQAAADNGNSRALYLVGQALMDGSIGLHRDQDEGIKLLTQAADASEGWAALRLATAHLRGEGVPRDADRAVELYNKAIDAGLPYATIALSDLYFGTALGRRQPKKGLAVLDEQAHKGNVRAIQQLLSFHGEGAWQNSRPDPKARAIYYALLGEFGTDSQIAAEDMVTQLRQGAAPTPSMAATFAAFPRDLQVLSISRILKVNQNAYVYLVQHKLAAQGFYQGSFNGLLGRSTIRAINAACSSQATNSCTNPLANTTGQYILNLS